jgi:hypothetical protein
MIQTGGTHRTHGATKDQTYMSWHMYGIMSVISEKLASLRRVSHGLKICTPHQMLSES